MDEIAYHAQNSLPTLREMAISNLIPPVKDASRLVPMASHSTRPPLDLVHPDVMEMGSSPPGPCDRVPFPTMNYSSRSVFQPFGARFDPFDRFIQWSMPAPMPHMTQMGGCVENYADSNDPSSAQKASHSDMGDTEHHSQRETSRSLDPQSSKTSQSPDPPRLASEPTPKEPEPVTPGSIFKTSNEGFKGPEFPEQKRQKSHENPSEPTTKSLPRVVTKFEDVPAHTAKCDTCNHRNSKGMIRCSGCGWQLCQACRQKRGGDLSHETFDCIHVEDPHLRSESESPAASPASGYQTPGPPSPGEQAAGTLTRTRYQTQMSRSPEEVAARILLDMSTPPLAGEDNAMSFTPTPSPKRRRSMPSTPTPSGRSNPRGTESSAEDSDVTFSSPSSVELEGTLTPNDWVRRNPTRNARPSRVRFD